ncbi:hypothetical protein B0H63DRAFT_88769 [Podospora didyma]|uniref:Heterokaryon incompatibility domain-containing protein n=1 Tax=Podospora didyma TaxID=330526 RepID=A0AAE0N273_9PEZI|nr:hypothetical protein B0H63DRAFT_88769 [Podospora didyma]
MELGGWWTGLGVEPASPDGNDDGHGLAPGSSYFLLHASQLDGMATEGLRLAVHVLFCAWVAADDRVWSCVDAVSSSAFEQWSDAKAQRLIVRLLKRKHFDELLKFEYADLRRPASQLRLLRVQRYISPFLKLEAELEVHDMDNHPPFKAVSYKWGDKGDLRNIVLNGRKHTFLANVHDILRRCCSPFRSLLWIDTVCINQANIKEKQHQICRMSDV